MKFEKIWTTSEESKSIVKKAWSTSNRDQISKLNYTLKCIFKWGREIFGNIHRSIQKAQEKLGNLRYISPTEHNTNSILEPEKDLDNKLKIEEIW